MWISFCENPQIYIYYCCRLTNETINDKILHVRCFEEFTWGSGRSSPDNCPQSNQPRMGEHESNQNKKGDDDFDFNADYRYCRLQLYKEE